VSKFLEVRKFWHSILKYKKATGDVIRDFFIDHLKHKSHPNFLFPKEKQNLASAQHNTSFSVEFLSSFSIKYFYSNKKFCHLEFEWNPNPGLSYIKLFTNQFL
jgi:hypothetical protein